MFQLMIFVTLESLDRMRLKLEKNLVSTSSLVGKEQQSERQPIAIISSQRALSVGHNIFIKKYSKKKFLKNAILVSCDPGNQIFINHVYYYFFFLEYYELFKALQLTLFHHKILNHSKRLCLFVSLLLFVLVTDLFS